MSAITWQGCGLFRQAVDDGNRRVARQLLHRLVIEDADHDGVDIAREHARRIGDALAASKLHFGAGEHDRLAAEFAHATSKDTRVRVEGRSKIIASVLPASGRGVGGSPLTRSDFIAAVASMMARSSRRHAEKIEEMPAGAAGAATLMPPRARFAGRALQAAASGIEAAHALAQFFLRKDEGGSRRTILSPAGIVEQLLRPRSGGEFGVGAPQASRRASNLRRVSPR